MNLGPVGHACGLRSDDSLWCWGRNDFGQLGLGTDGEPQTTPMQVPGSWSAVAAGAVHTCAIATDGTLWCWGRAGEGTLGIGPAAEDAIFSTPTAVGTADNWIEIAAGSGSCGRRQDGSLWCWGPNSNGQLGQGTVDEDAGSNIPLQVGTETDWSEPSIWGDTVCGRRGNELWCWGDNNSGRQGNDTIFISGQPRQVRNDG
ncbi:MAG: hypothetical protein K0V04_27650 [Deltaproteobacteria bacterium]|nr:hypothetical protein [Deltaproteobacteria bacterium]